MSTFARIIAFRIEAPVVKLWMVNYPTMSVPSDGVDEDIKESLRGAVEGDEYEEVIDALDEALQHTDDEDAEYWIRTALQYLLVEDR
ncbi:MAG: hypothetical protein ABEH78_06515 [Haloferacaceae archaeon]